MPEHSIPPIYDKNSKVLILGSFPSVSSREAGFFYGHKQNRFWNVIADILNKSIPENILQKKQMLLEAGIALWDVIAFCEISGSADSTIKNVVPNNIIDILNCTGIRQIFVNGKVAEKYYNKYIRNEINRKCICLPSTSPANAAWSLSKLIEKWSILQDYLDIY